MGGEAPSDGDRSSDDQPEPSAIGRWVAISRFAGSRIAAQARRRPRRTAVTVGLVALTIALLVIVTGISVALAGGTATDDEVDLRVVPDGGGTLSPVVEVEGPRLSDVHDRTADIDDREDVDYATPVLMEVVRVRPVDGGASTSALTDGDEPNDTADEPGGALGANSTNVMAVGVVPREASPPVGGVPTDVLEPGDPHYAGGDYDGTHTGDVVLSTAAAEQLEAAEGESLAVTSPLTGAVSEKFEVTTVENADNGGLSSGMPVVVLRLSELQSLTGAANEDLADQVLVGTDSDDARAATAAAYPNATVESGEEPGLAALGDDDLALATGAIASIVGISICTLFVTTASGLLVERERRTLAVLAAVGFSSGSRLAVVVVMTLALTVAGGVIGVVLGYAGVALANAVATATVASSDIATTDPLFVPYALAVAVVAGLLALPYPLYLTTKTDVISELRQ